MPRESRAPNLREHEARRIFDSGLVVVTDLSHWTRGKGAIREGKLVVWTHTIAEIVRHTRPVGPIDFTAQKLVYDIAL